MRVSISHVFNVFSNRVSMILCVMSCFVFFSLMGLFAGCEKTEPPVEIQHVVIDETTVPVAVPYHRFNLQDIRLVIIYSDGTRDKVPIEASMMSAADYDRLQTPGLHTVTVNYESFEITLEISLDIPLPEFVQVGEVGETYIVPTGFSSQPNPVEGGYYMAKTQTTYALWYYVRVWALEAGYHFQHPGQEGSKGERGQAPSSAGFHPVTTVSWFDTIVWLNALSEYYGLEPVYRDLEGDVLRDSRHSQNAVLEQAVHTDHGGFRLPTPHEWDMAARWKNDTTSTHGSVLVGERYWTPGNYASGALTSADDMGATRVVAWFRGAPGGDSTRPVGLLGRNHLGLYDMSGNVWEWTNLINSVGWTQARGGSYFEQASSVTVSMPFSTAPDDPWSIIGFRIVINEMPE